MTDPFHPLKPGDIAGSTVHSFPLSAYKNLPFCPVPGTSFLSAGWDAVQLMNRCIRPIRSVTFTQLNFVFSAVLLI